MSAVAYDVVGHIIAVWPGLPLKSKARWARKIADNHYEGDYDRAYAVLAGEEDR